MAHTRRLPRLGALAAWVSVSMRSITRRGLIAASFVLLVFAVVAVSVEHFVWPPRYPRPSFDFGAVSDNACGTDTGPVVGANSSIEAHQTIPNLVHYVWLLKEPTHFQLSFTFFVSVYSAHLFWHPDTIYIHTDAAADVISAARTSGSTWTQRILAIPKVTINHVVALDTTDKGVKIEKFPHKADFARMAVLREFGGVYLDSDAVPLRDVSPLRNSGFRNVVGGQISLAVWFAGYLNNGVMMSVPNSNLMTIFYHAAHEFFDGQWETASINLLTDLANRMVSIPSEVLILQPQAFDPTSWEFKDVERLWKPVMDPIPVDFNHREPPLKQTIDGGLGTCQDALAWLKKQKNKGEKHPWEIDFSSSYVMHAFDGWLEDVLGKGQQVDVQYVLDRRSNYARAVFPAVWEAVLQGIIPRDEIVL